MLEIINKHFLNNDPNFAYTNATYINNQYLILDDKDPVIHYYNSNYSYLDTYSTLEKYNSLTYNEIENHLVTSNVKSQTEMDQLNLDLSFYSRFPLSIYKYVMGNIVDIYFNDTNQNYYIATRSSIYSVNDFGAFINELTNVRKFLNVFSNNCINISNSVLLRSLSFTAVGVYNNDIYIGYTKNNSAYLARISNNGNIIENTFIGDNVTIASIMDVNGILELLINSSDGNKYIYQLGSIVPTLTTSGTAVEGSTSSSINYNNFNSLINNLSIKEEAVADLIRVESNKLARIINTTDNTNEILEANKQVNEVIKTITKLEENAIKELSDIIQVISRQ